ncbi:MAG TPA: M15 family metallopeptidase [Salinimicrobium sp.]|nr:M15 family metallopeptidase [Salinimicrobium sp.]
MTLSEKQRIFTRNIAKLIEYAYCNNIELTFGHAWRSEEEQRRLVNEGKSQTMNSNHLNRLAVDFNVFVDGELTWKWEDIKPLGDYWETLNDKNRWGGDWNNNEIKDGFIDSPHFEMQL